MAVGLNELSERERERIVAVTTNDGRAIEFLPPGGSIRGDKVAEVLMVPLEKVRPKTALVEELGAESIDFLDLVFRLEEALGRKIPVAHWGAFVRERLCGQDLSVAITTDIVREFVEAEAGRS